MNKKSLELEIGGISFGLSSGIITTLGMIVGIDGATKSKVAIIAAILTIAIADSLSDALGMHLSEESRLDEKSKPIWVISIFTFLGKFIFSTLFILPFLFLDIAIAVKLSIAAGLLALLLLTMYITRRRKESVWGQILENCGLAILVLISSYAIGRLASDFIR